ncbi:MAG TPA: T9SS type A sorting domain-containing protein [Flavilitoribacter sp.]|nr:T9SS type A sorting domain-containing protein [Flavilitoribacter sp.]HMQ87587.1 T9SS type A sorting domain-containing protein [Flavilitoribacter sp.]
MKIPVLCAAGLLACNFLSAQPPVYLYLASHNETNDRSFHGLDYDNAADYAVIRDLAQAICDSVLAYDAAYVMMPESNFINACLKHENAHTNPEDLLQWADKQPQIEIEPHNHFSLTAGPGYNPYNYADLAYLLDSCGLTPPRKLMGGFIWRNFNSPSVTEDWTLWQTPQPGHTFPGYTWQPQILWGGGSPGHVDDFEAFGVWRPAAPTIAGFGANDPDQPLVCLGNGCNNEFIITDTTNVELLANRVINLLDDIRNGAWPPDAFFSFKIMMNFRHLPSPGYVDKVGELLRRLQPYREAGYFVWATAEEAVAAWQDLHPSTDDHFLAGCGDFTISSDAPTLTGLNHDLYNHVPLKVFPNPAGDWVRLQAGSEPIERIRFYDLFGRLLLQVNDPESGEIRIGNLPSGIIVVIAENRLQKTAVRMIKE